MNTKNLFYLKITIAESPFENKARRNNEPGITKPPSNAPDNTKI